MTDSGDGIPEEVRSKIGIEQIHKAEDTEGMGMGLVMALTVAEAFGGTMEAPPTHGQGATIILRFPAVSGWPERKVPDV